MWHEIDAEHGNTLLRIVGGVDTGDDAELDRVAAGCDAGDVAYEWLEAAFASQRFPGLAFRGRALWQPDAGCVGADAAVDAFARSALAHGAAIHRSEPVTRIAKQGDGVEVTTGRGVYRAAAVVVTTGAWARATLANLAPIPPITVTQEQVGFFRPRGDIVFPTFIERREISTYGLPTPDGLLKIAEHYTGPVVDPDTRSGALDQRTWSRLLDWVRAHVPGVDPEPVHHSTCLYASTPDEDFVIDRVGRVTVGVGLGGHGFKFLPVLGLRLAELATGTPWPENPFGFARRNDIAGNAGHK